MLSVHNMTAMLYNLRNYINRRPCVVSKSFRPTLCLFRPLKAPHATYKVIWLTFRAQLAFECRTTLYLCECIKTSSYVICSASLLHFDVCVLKDCRRKLILLALPIVFQFP